MTESFSQHYLADALSTFQGYKTLAERAIDQTTDEELFAKLDEESNSIAVIMKHLAGNMLSRWTDFLTTDGEKPDRKRDLEFVVHEHTSRSELNEYWEQGWQSLFAALESLSVDDFDKKIFIRSEEHTVVQAINRQLTHYAYHVGQLVFLAKHFRSSAWQSLSVPRNRSAEFNQYLTENAGATEPRVENLAPIERAARFAAQLSANTLMDRARDHEEREEGPMFLGLRTAIYQVSDIAKAREWYSNVLGFGPYFDEPFYVGFNVGGYELGLQPSENEAVNKNEGVIAYWGVESAETALERLNALGGTTHEAVQDVGGGIKVATVKDPFGNVFGVIENPHFKLPG